MREKATREIRTLLIVYVVLLVGVYGVILLSFRFIRDAFPKPTITSDPVVGYIHYNGYPLYFDTFLFFIIFVSPTVICTIMYYGKKFLK